MTGVGNTRELGGYACEDGRVVRPGVFLRAAASANAAEEEVRKRILPVAAAMI